MAYQPIQWNLPGVTLRGEMRGTAPTAVFLHGLGGQMADWNPVWDRLGPAFAAIRYDMRGSGASTAHDDATFSHADDLLALLDAQGIDRADLIGVSMGGSVAMHCALNHPDRVRRLILISPGLMAWDWSAQWRALWRPIAASARENDLPGARRLWADHPLFAPVRADPALASALLASIDRYDGHDWIGDNQLPVLPDVDRLPTLAASTMLLTGELDLPDFRLIADLIAGAVPDVERIDFGNRGHLLTLEAPDACATVITAFLSGD